MRSCKVFNDAGFSSGAEKDGIPCDTFDDIPPKTIEEIILELQAGGQASDLRLRQGYYTNSELQDYIESEYACDYIQQYKDYKANKVKSYQSQFVRESEIAGKTAEVVKSSAVEKKESVSTPPAVSPVPPAQRAGGDGEWVVT